MKEINIRRIKFNIYFKILAIIILTLVLMHLFVPRLLNYPPFSDSSGFQPRVDIIPQRYQYLLFGFIGVIVFIISINIIFKNIFKYIKIKDKSKISFDFIKTVRKDCLTASRKIVTVHIFLIIIVLFVLLLIMKPSASLFFKLVLIYFSFFTFIAVLSTSFIKKDLDSVIESTYRVNSTYTDFQKDHKFSVGLIFNLFPFFLVMVITVALLGYGQTSSSIGEGSYYYYKIYLENTKLDGLTFSELITALNRIPLKSENDYYFIINKDIQYFSKPNGKVTEFFLKYANAYLDVNSGRVYEYYGLEEEAYVKRHTIGENNNVYIGFKYSTVNDTVDSFYLDISITFTIIYIIILLIWSRNLSKSLVDVANNLTKISEDKTVHDAHILPITSADEIGELTIAFNNIQKLAKENVEKIQDDHEKLMERERLASLGQLIGGIAHNLKTPIMSISGATEGLSDLVKEYDSSIEDNEVTSNDHHEIAKEMADWIEKIKNHTFYMSEVITAVKGQAVTFSKEYSTSFEIEELVKRVEILMKHEIKNALVNLNVSINTDPKTVLSGNIVSLVQVINNMISNSIQVYDGEPNKDIDLIISKSGNNIIISIKDYGPGMPDEIKNKLFKEMITTKGKNGTGLGLFMSYSNIKAHFHGNITVESTEGKGTTFNIILPIN